MTEQLEGQMSIFDLVSPSGKTYQEPLAATKGKTSKQSSKRFVKSGGGTNHIVPMPPANKWLHFGTIVGDGWSLAWRIYDAQFWGVPQRRKRIYLIADFGSERAGEILSERESVSGHLEPGEQAREGTAADAERSAGRSYLSFPWNNSANAGLSVDKVSPTVKATRCGEPAVVYAIGAYNSNAWKSDNPHSGVYEADKTRTLDLNGGNLTCQQGGTVIVENVWPDVARGLCARADSSPCIDRGQNVVVYSSSSHGTLSEGVGTGTRAVHEMVAVFDARCNGEGDVCPTIAGDHENRVTDYTALAVARCQSMSEYAIDGTTSTIKARDFKGGAVDVVVEKRPQRKYIVRRLMPIECCRLQGFPDWWTDGADGSDSAEYKLWGNGIALPCAADVIGRIAKELRKGAET